MIKHGLLGITWFKKKCFLVTNLVSLSLSFFSLYSVGRRTWGRDGWGGEATRHGLTASSGVRSRTAQRTCSLIQGFYPTRKYDRKMRRSTVRKRESSIWKPVIHALYQPGSVCECCTRGLADSTATLGDQTQPKWPVSAARPLRGHVLEIEWTGPNSARAAIELSCPEWRKCRKWDQVQKCNYYLTWGGIHLNSIKSLFFSLLIENPYPQKTALLSIFIFFTVNN